MLKLKYYVVLVVDISARAPAVARKDGKDMENFGFVEANLRDFKNYKELLAARKKREDYIMNTELITKLKFRNSEKEAQQLKEHEMKNVKPIPGFENFRGDLEEPGKS